MNVPMDLVSKKQLDSKLELPVIDFKEMYYLTSSKRMSPIT